jgi:hypothetical protein
VLEVASNGDGTVSLMIDADSPRVATPHNLSTAGLASYYRELAFNDIGLRDRGGRAADRNTELILTDPL